MIGILEQFWDDERGIEGLPLKYIVAILVAVVVISIVAQMTGILQTGVRESSEQVSNRTTGLVSTSFDQLNKTIQGK